MTPSSFKVRTSCTKQEVSGGYTTQVQTSPSDCSVCNEHEVTLSTFQSKDILLGNTVRGRKELKVRRLLLIVTSAGSKNRRFRVFKARTSHNITVVRRGK
jgi:hypothetical protein